MVHWEEAEKGGKEVENAISYGVLERALGKVFKLSPDATAGLLRGRIIHLRKAGFGPRGQGYGSRISYDHETAVKWLLALLFEDAGLSPLNAYGLIEGTWEHHLAKIIAKANKSKTDTYLVVSFSELRSAAGMPTIPQVWSQTAREASKLLRWIDAAHHVTVFNLSDSLKTLNRELAID